MGLVHYECGIDEIGRTPVPPRFDRLRIRIHSPGWTLEEIYSRPDRLTRRLDELRKLWALSKESVVPLSAWRPYRAACVSPLEIDGGHLPSVVEAWSDHGGRFSPDLVARLQKLDLLGRTIVLREKHDGRLFYQYIGPELQERFGEVWVRDATRRPIDWDEQHDPEFSAWCAEAYFAAYFDQQPTRHHVDALIAEVAGERKIRVNYDRVMLPITTMDGTPGLMVVSEQRAGLLPL